MYISTVVYEIISLNMGTNFFYTTPGYTLPQTSENLPFFAYCYFPKFFLLLFNSEIMLIIHTFLWIKKARRLKCQGRENRRSLFGINRTHHRVNLYSNPGVQNDKVCPFCIQWRSHVLYPCAVKRPGYEVDRK